MLAVGKMRSRLCIRMTFINEISRLCSYQIAVAITIIYLQYASAFCPASLPSSTILTAFAPRRSTSLCASIRDIDHLMPEHEGFPIEVSFEGMTCKFNVRPNESILSALERTGAGDALCLPTIPHECRKGACLTCTGKHAPGSSASNLTNDNALTQSTSIDVQNAGFVLICSSFVLGEGVKLELGQNSEAWDEIHHKRFATEEAQLLGRAATAYTMRLAAERNVENWKKQTSEVIKWTPNEEDFPFQ